MINAVLVEERFVYNIREEGRDIEDERLVDRILAGDDEAFRLLVQKYANNIYQLAYGVLRNAKDAEDAAQEAFVRMYLSFPRYERKGLKTWMSRIAVNKAIDWKRRQTRRKETELTEPNMQPIRAELSLPGTDKEVLNKLNKELVRLKVQSLPERYRVVVTGYYLEDKSYRQIAVELGIEEKSVASRLFRAKQWMREHWKEEDF